MRALETEVVDAVFAAIAPGDAGLPERLPEPVSGVPLTERDAEKESINDDVVFEIELIRQVEINVDYILMLVERFRDARGDGHDKEIRAARAGSGLEPVVAQQEGPHRGVRRVAVDHLGS